MSGRHVELVRLLAPADRRDALEHDVRIGLAATPKSLPPIWFYDERGSELFDEITRQPEYYLTEAERPILLDHADEIAGLVDVEALVELGSGTSEKTDLLLAALTRDGSLRRFVPLDVCEAVLEEAGPHIAARYDIDVTSVVGDFHRHLGEIPAAEGRLFAFLGSTVGNLDAPARAVFFTQLAAVMTPDDALLLGTDLDKDPARLEAAYDDAAGVTAAFNLNLLSVLRTELGADVDVAAFAHVARYDAPTGEVRMSLRSLRDQVVSLAALDLRVSFAAGEEILTEISTKFRAPELAEELWTAGFAVVKAWNDRAGDFQLTLARPIA